MTDVLTPPPPVPPTPPAQPSDPRPPSAPAPRSAQRRTGAIVAIIVGCVLLLPGVGLLTGGGTMAFGQAVATDDDGFFRFSLDRIESGGIAVVAQDVWLDEAEGDASPWLFDFLDVDLRLRVDGVDASEDVFVGIGRSEDVAAYLAGTGYSEIVELNDRTPRYELIDGSRSIESPLDQSFWTVSVSGTGEQQLDWDARGGTWSVVVMNADGSSAVTADVELGARSGAVTPIAVAMIVMGATIVLVAGGIVFAGVRAARRRPTPAL